MLGGGGPAIEVNRLTNPPAMNLRVGVKYRFRLINITPNFTATVSLRGDGGAVQWRAVAKDGADLPPSQIVKRAAQQIISVGETYDFEFEPTTPGELRLEVLRRGAAGFLTSTSSASHARPCPLVTHEDDEGMKPVLVKPKAHFIPSILHV